MANVVTIKLNDNLYIKTKKPSNYEIPKKPELIISTEKEKVESTITKSQIEGHIY